MFDRVYRMIRWILYLSVLLALLLDIYSLFVVRGPDLLFENSDFEKGTLLHWTAQGTAFLNQPTEGDNAGVRGRGSVAPYDHYWIGTYENHPAGGRTPAGAAQGDGPVGTLTSIPFTIAGDAITFMMGAGNDSDGTGVALEVDGVRVRFERGRGIYPDSEVMARVTWDVRAWRGKKGQIVIIDNASTHWGHLNADDFRYDWK